jgi:putative transcriptional regulator
MTELNIPSLLKEIRRQLGMTQEQLAHQIGVSFTSVNQWERGRRRPIPMAIEKIKTLAKKANIDLANFSDADDGGR